MDNLKQYIRENYEADDIKDIALRGCVNGFSGVTYYSETTDLYNKFHKDISRMFMVPGTDCLNRYHDKTRRLNYVKITTKLE